MDRVFRGAAAFALMTLWALPSAAEPATGGALREVIPSAISPQAHAIFEALLPGVAARRKLVKIPRTQAEFDARNAAIVAGPESQADALLKARGAAATTRHLGGVGVLETTPPQYKDDGTVLIRVHGGGFIQGSARSSIGMDIDMAIATGRRVLSIDYTLAPRGKWNTVTDQVIAVYKSVLAEGYKAQDIGMFGDSAGGNIVPASVLKLRDQGLPMPGAVLLLSPCVDFNLNGDTETTLADADPALANREDLINGLKAYADPTEWKNPYVSPIYGDFTKGFPPVLLQVGTREILLSDSVRFYQAVKAAGGDAQLDIYEGMTHVFQTYMANTPEGKAAYAEIARFWSHHLASRKP
ncbi:MAG: alpha/beta hydrolase [Rhizomicrobium sp.]